MNRIMAKLNFIFAAKVAAVVILVVALAYGVFFAAAISNGIGALAALAAMLIGIFGTIYILYPAWYTDNEFSL